MAQIQREQVDPSRQEATSGRVLIVDDEAPLALALRRVLCAHGHDVVIASDGAEGLAQVTAEAWDLVFLDIRLPKLSGIEVLERIKDRDPWLSVLIMTGYATVESAVQAVQLGALNYLTKPFDDIFHVCGELASHAINQTRRGRPDEGRSHSARRTAAPFEQRADRHSLIMASNLMSGDEPLRRDPGQGRPLASDEAPKGIVEGVRMLEREACGAALSDLQFMEAKQRAIETFEASYVAELMERTGGNISQAAREAGMDRSNFKRLLKKFQLQWAV